jgi:hypothetical protein
MNPGLDIDNDHIISPLQTVGSLVSVRDKPPLISFGVLWAYSKNLTLSKRTLVIILLSSFANTLFTLTWSVFGMGSLDAPAIEGGETPIMSLTNNPTRNVAVETVGFYLYGIYVFASMIVLLNLLIAVMSNSFQEVQVS